MSGESEGSSHIIWRDVLPVSWGNRYPSLAVRLESIRCSWSCLPLGWNVDRNANLPSRRDIEGPDQKEADH